MGLQDKDPEGMAGPVHLFDCTVEALKTSDKLTNQLYRVYRQYKGAWYIIRQW